MKKIILGTLVATSLLFGARVDVGGGLHFGTSNIEAYSLYSEETISTTAMSIGVDVNTPLDRRNKGFTVGMGGSVNFPLGSNAKEDYEVGTLSEIHLTLGLKLNKVMTTYVSGNLGYQTIEDNVLDKTSNYSGSGFTYGVDLKLNRQSSLGFNYSAYTMTNENNAEMDLTVIGVRYALNF